jgi:hypothetical protein
VVSGLAGRITVPQRDREAVETLLKLEANVGKQLADEIDRSDGSLKSLLTLLDNHGLNGRLTWRALVSLILTGRVYRMGAEGIVEGVREQLESEDRGDGMLAIIESPRVQQFVKASTLRTEYERILLDTRIISDIRPVFDDSQDTPSIQAAIVDHTLRIMYTGGDGHRHEAHYALDIGDLETLHEQTAKALKKDAAARTMITDAGVAVIQPMPPLEESQ